MKTTIYLAVFCGTLAASTAYANNVTVASHPDKVCTPGEFCVRIILPTLSGQRGEEFSLYMDYDFVFKGIPESNTAIWHFSPGNHMLMYIWPIINFDSAKIKLYDFQHRNSSSDNYTPGNGECNFNFPPGVNIQYDIKVNYNEQSGYSCTIVH